MGVDLDACARQREGTTSLEGERVGEVIGAETGGEHVGEEGEGGEGEVAVDVALDEGVVEDGGWVGNLVE